MIDMIGKIDMTEKIMVDMIEVIVPIEENVVEKEDLDHQHQEDHMIHREIHVQMIKEFDLNKFLN